MTERDILSDKPHSRVKAETDRPVHAASRAGLFRLLCAGVAGAAFFQMIAPVEDGWRDFFGLAPAYAVWSAIAVGLSFLFYAVATRVLVADVRGLSAKQFYVGWVSAHLRTLPSSFTAPSSIP